MPISAIDKIAILAPGLWGKSTLARHLLPAFPRVIILDVVTDFPPTEETDFVVESIAELGEIAKLIVTHRPKEFRIVRRYSESFDGDYPADLDAVIGLAYAVATKAAPVLIVADEFQEFARGEKMSHPLRTLLLRGRHRGVGIMGLSPRASEIPKVFLEQCGHLFFGGYTEPNTLKYIGGVLEKNTINSLRLLKKSEFIYLEKPNSVRKIGPLFQ